jgi:hypothetical protein
METRSYLDMSPMSFALSVVAVTAKLCNGKVLVFSGVPTALYPSAFYEHQDTA